MNDYLNFDGTSTEQPPAEGDFLGGYPADAGYADQGQPGGGYFDSNTQAAPPAAPQPMDGGFSPNLTVQPPYLEEVQPSPVVLGGARSDLSELVLDVEVPVEVYFGRAALTVEEFLELNRGAILELDKPIDAPIELRVRGKKVAEGQLVTINGSYGLRVVRMFEENK